MTPPPAGPGQRTVLNTHYDRIGGAPVAYLDETYHVEKDGRRRFYVMSAVVVLAHDRDPMRKELDELVPDGWWHTTESLRSIEGRDRARELLSVFQVPEETCVIVDKASVADDDADGALARRAVLERLLVAVHNGEDGVHPPAPLTVLEEQRVSRANNFDRTIRNDLIAAESIPATSTFAAVSPGSEHLLWLPDLVCSAYRQQLLFSRTDLFDEVRDMTRVVRLD